MKKIFSTLMVVCLLFCATIAQTREEVSVWTRQADIGDVSMQKFLGELLLTGNEEGMPKDREKALYWYSRAADQGDADSQFILAMEYRDSDKEKALHYMIEYAGQGFANGQAVLGFWYMGNDGFVKNYQQAVYWLQKAAEQGNLDAQKDLSLCYAKGYGVQKDENMAKYWSEKSQSQDTDKTLAEIQWLDFKSYVMTSNMQLYIGIKSNSKIENVTLTLNGETIKGLKEIKGLGFNINLQGNINLAEGANVLKIAVTNAVGTRREEKSVVYALASNNLASVDWLEFEASASSRDYKMKLGIKSDSKIEDVSILLNGVQERGINVVEVDGYDMTVEKTVTLADGLNRIVASIRSPEGIVTTERVVVYNNIKTKRKFDDKRIAMVVGNSKYSNEIMNLRNPEHDATDVAAKLKELGFDVMLLIDADFETMDRQLSEFGTRAKDYDVAMFFYAGHGIQSKGVNYLLPTDINNLTEDNIMFKCINMERILVIMEGSNCKLNIVVLDACRNDPISRAWHRGAEGYGLSIMNAPSGTIISFSTAPGYTALDGQGEHSPYTEAFLNNLDIPDIDVLQFLKMVGAEVIEKTKNAQRPWMSSSFTGDFYFNRQQ
ncbi:MAG: caspase family protein [Bacteroidales bacterium]|nr:caspase family protein [Bacteroidales bacterium]MBQ2077364.1 caspase family protein [Bacteroidales bacterium]MBQ2542563.1 caspase family protein [Bacteroidales bacterium]MBQ2574061.1 caspase family protein [Bacteroidales bacterium]